MYSNAKNNCLDYYLLTRKSKNLYKEILVVCWSGVQVLSQLQDRGSLCKAIVSPHQSEKVCKATEQCGVHWSAVRVHE